MKPIQILLIYTGGTIGMVKSPESEVLQAFDFKNILNHIPELNLLDCNIETVSFSTPIDSSEMSIKHWIKIATEIEFNYAKYDGFVVLHGSDTMSYSASALSFMLENLKKPVIFTGSQLPIGDLRTDAKENLITAIQLASLQQNHTPIIQEVGLYFEYKLYRANRTTKINANHFEAFNSFNFPPLITSGVALEVQEALLLRSSNGSLKIHKTLDDRVGILKLFPGVSPKYVESILSTPDLKGLILETYGSGNAPTTSWFLEALNKAISKGLYVVNVTQCLGGSVRMGQYKTSQALLEIGVISGKDMTTEAAITKMMFLLGQRISKNSFKSIYETSLRGELTEK